MLEMKIERIDSEISDDTIDFALHIMFGWRIGIGKDKIDIEIKREGNTLYLKANKGNSEARSDAPDYVKYLNEEEDKFRNYVKELHRNLQKFHDQNSYKARIS